ncbi:MAG: copper resistance protein CopC [Ktedonobacteraceae bacterium]
MHTPNRFTRIVAAALFSLGLLFVIAGTVSAHAKVLDAIPAIGSTITQPPTKVTVHTAENINPNPKLSNLFVYGPSGDLISQGDASVPLSNPKEMSVAIKSDGNGVYVVRWITVSALDGDPDQGAFVFTVKPTAAATPVASTGPTTTQTNTSGSGGTPLWATILIGVVALVVGLGAGLGIGRTTTKSSSLSSMRQAVAAEQDKTPTSTKRP